MIGLTVIDNADGSGATATISGIDVEQYVEVLAVQVGVGTSLANWPVDQWTYVAGRTGPGTLNLPLSAGCFFAIAQGGDVSVPAYFLVTTAAESIQWNCMLAVQAAIRLANLPELLSASVVLVKLPREVLTKELSARYPLIAISPQPFSHSQASNVHDEGTYPVFVAAVDVDNREVAVAPRLPRHLLWLETISAMFRFQPLTGFPSVIGCEVENTDIVWPQGYDSNLLVGGLKLKFKTREPRGLRTF
jgi:hypothetical protein